ncbi:MAG: DEAD/DEAH box helicase [Holophagaceae bacterium]|nr:DEAD/DEAH box helicase [Holophagaceae bacterium]
MMSPSWILDSIDASRIEEAKGEAARRRIFKALQLQPGFPFGESNLDHASRVLDLALYGQLLQPVPDIEQIRSLASRTFEVMRTITAPEGSADHLEWLLRLTCLAVLADRSADARRILKLEPLEVDGVSNEWGQRVKNSIYSAWLLIIRKQGWEDLRKVQESVDTLRTLQGEFEQHYLEAQGEGQVGKTAAWELVALYHLAKAAELMAAFTNQGVVEGTFDIGPKLQAQFDRALLACEHGNLAALEVLVRTLALSSTELCRNSIWSISRAVPSKVRKFIEGLASPDRLNPLFELLPPQRRTLQERGLISSGRRSIVISLPTSSGKTLIAQFRILQALNQFEDVAGWVAYLAPTRALVNQITANLRRDFSPLGISVERVSPVLDVDGQEENLLNDQDPLSRFRVLVTTPEKLDLMLRMGWEDKIGRPLTLVVVDEAHNLDSESRGLKLELMLATINRECREAQFLLLTPFIRNAKEIASWLDPNNNEDFDMSVEWQPNDRVIALSRPVQGPARDDFHLTFTTLHTSKNTLTLPESVALPENRPLSFKWSDVKNGLGKIAAATADILKHRGAVVVLCRDPGSCWKVTGHLLRQPQPTQNLPDDVQEVCDFLHAAFGSRFPLTELVERRVGVHHAGLPEDARCLMEWLLTNNHIDVLAATTTLAQGVNFPVSAVVLVSQYLPRRSMTSSEFWNIAGRAGRVDQGDLGIVAIACDGDEQEETLTQFVNKSVEDINSRLVSMVQAVLTAAGELPHLADLYQRVEWSPFLQYLAHTYRQIGDPYKFATQIEEILRGTFGFASLRQTNPRAAMQFLDVVRQYAEQLQGHPLKLVDLTGFSWESVSLALARLRTEQITAKSWDTSRLFAGPSLPLQKMMGILLAVPELRENLSEAIGGTKPDGNLLARIVSDWVQGASLEIMAERYYNGGKPFSETPPDEATLAMTHCGQSLFGRLTQTTSWGLAALQSMTVKDADREKLPPSEQQSLKNLPARVFYGVNSDEAITLRLLGVPREAAQPLAHGLGNEFLARPLSQIRMDLHGNGARPWVDALGPIGKAYHRAWTIMEGSD